MNKQPDIQPDPFHDFREKGAFVRCEFQGESVPMILRHADVRAAAQDWETFSSDASFRIPIPSAENLRTTRQLPIETNLGEQLDRALADPGDDFFSALTREEQMGLASLTFAGGRDPFIHTISSVTTHLAEHPENLEFLREDPKPMVHAAEEFFRVVAPLTHIGRVCPVDTEVHGTPVMANGRVSLCWASANRDEHVFDHPVEVRLDRKPNPHVAFGFGAHLRLGAAHTRLLLRTFLKALVDRVSEITLVDEEKNIEQTARYRRSVGYRSQAVRFHAPSEQAGVP